MIAGRAPTPVSGTSAVSKQALPPLIYPSQGVHTSLNPLKRVVHTSALVAAQALILPHPVVIDAATPTAHAVVIIHPVVKRTSIAVLLTAV